jgi:hypothetical protein
LAIPRFSLTVACRKISCGGPYLHRPLFVKEQTAPASDYYTAPGHPVKRRAGRSMCCFGTAPCPPCSVPTAQSETVPPGVCLSKEHRPERARATRRPDKSASHRSARPPAARFAQCSRTRPSCQETRMKKTPPPRTAGHAGAGRDAARPPRKAFRGIWRASRHVAALPAAPAPRARAVARCKGKRSTDGGFSVLNPRRDRDTNTTMPRGEVRVPGWTGCDPDSRPVERALLTL